MSRRVTFAIVLTASATVFGAACDQGTTGPRVGEPSGLEIVVQPSAAVAGEPLAPAVVVEIRDAAGNRVETSAATVTVRIGPGGSAGATLEGAPVSGDHLTGTTSVQAEEGVATFSDLRVGTAGSGYTLEASAEGLTTARSVTFDVEPGEAERLVFTTQPASGTAGVSLDPAVEVEVRDRFGNAITDFSGDVSLTLDEDPTDGAATLRGTTTASVSDGVALFADLEIREAADGYRLMADDRDLTAAVSEPFNVAAASPAGLEFVDPQPSAREVRRPFDPPVRVRVVDEFGNASLFSGTISLEISDGATGVDATLSGTTELSVTNQSEVVAADLSVAEPGELFSLQASADTLASAVSQPFDMRLFLEQIAAGEDHSCGLTASGFAYCWGSNSSGQLGDGTTDSRESPVPVATDSTFSLIAAGGAHSCAVSGDRIYCWGLDREGQLGVGNTTGSENTPVEVAAPREEYRALAAGDMHTCAVAESGDAFCWGRNSEGQLGDGSFSEQTTPVQLSLGEDLVRISAAGNHTCAEEFLSGKAHCWGANGSGQVGNGTTNDQGLPVALLGGEPVIRQVSAGRTHTCAVLTSTGMLCWGEGTAGQLGDGNSSDSSTPVGVRGTQEFVTTAAGGRHSCAITTTGTLFCWGENGSGQLGLVGPQHRAVPTVVTNREGEVLEFEQVTAGGSHGCGISAEGDAMCWGSDADGQQGTGPLAPRAFPAAIVGGEGEG